MAETDAGCIVCQKSNAWGDFKCRPMRFEFYMSAIWRVIEAPRECLKIGSLKIRTKIFNNITYKCNKYVSDAKCLR